MAESFSSPGGVSGSRPQNSQATGVPGINHASIGTQFNGYVGGLSQPVNNDETTLLVRCEVISPQPDDESAAGERMAGDTY